MSRTFGTLWSWTVEECRHWAVNILFYWRLAPNGCWKCNFYDINVIVTPHAFVPLGHLLVIRKPTFIALYIFQIFSKVLSHMVFMTIQWSKSVKYIFLKLNPEIQGSWVIMCKAHNQSVEGLAHESWLTILRISFYDEEPEYGTCSSDLNCF